jgi:hypothetical protein
VRLKLKKDRNEPTDMEGIYKRIWSGLMPGFVNGRDKDKDMQMIQQALTENIESLT